MVDVNVKRRFSKQEINSLKQVTLNVKLIKKSTDTFLAKWTWY